MRGFAFALFMASIALAAGHLAWMGPQLPELVPTHFGVGGEADGWSSREAAITFYAVMLSLMGGLFLGMALWIPRLPSDFVNLPHREIWLAPERRKATLSWLASSLLHVGSLTMGFLIGIQHLSFRVALGRASGLGIGFGLLLVGYLALLIGWVIVLKRRFARPA